MSADVTQDEAVDLLVAAAFEENLDEGDDSEPRTLIHAFSHGAGIALGADWTIGQAVDYVRGADLIVWVEHSLHHDLEVKAGDRLVYFDVRRPT